MHVLVVPSVCDTISWRGRVGKGFPGSPISFRSKSESCPRNNGKKKIALVRDASRSADRALTLSTFVLPRYPHEGYLFLSVWLWSKTRTRRGSGFAGENPDAKLKIPAGAGILRSTNNKSALLFRSRAITLRTLLFMRGMVAL
jgi:hypothetical protein